MLRTTLQSTQVCCVVYRYTAICFGSKRRTLKIVWDTPLRTIWLICFVICRSGSVRVFNLGRNMSNSIIQLLIYRDSVFEFFGSFDLWDTAGGVVYSSETKNLWIFFPVGLFFNFKSDKKFSFLKALSGAYSRGDILPIERFHVEVFEETAWFFSLRFFNKFNQAE